MKKLVNFFGFIYPLTWGVGVYYTSNRPVSSRWEFLWLRLRTQWGWFCRLRPCRGISSKRLLQRSRRLIRFRGGRRRILLGRSSCRCRRSPCFWRLWRGLWIHLRLSFSAVASSSLTKPARRSLLVAIFNLI